MRTFPVRRADAALLVEVHDLAKWASDLRGVVGARPEDPRRFLVGERHDEIVPGKVALSFGSEEHIIGVLRDRIGCAVLGRLIPGRHVAIDNLQLLDRAHEEPHALSFQVGLPVIEPRLAGRAHESHVVDERILHVEAQKLDIDIKLRSGV
jgi:hypothetical protein